MLHLMAKRNYSDKNDWYIDNLNGVEKKEMREKFR